MHRQTDLDTSSELDDDFDFVFDLQSLELFETTPVTRPPGEVDAQELELGDLTHRLARLARAGLAGSALDPRSPLVQRPDDLEPDDPECELDVEFVFDLDSDEPLEVAPIEEEDPDSAERKSPFIPEDPELEWVARWRRNQKKRKRG